jgi:hypothetical protein
MDTDTAALRAKMLKLWQLFEQGKLSATEARVHIGFARTVVETIKVEIAAAHLGPAAIRPLTARESRILKLAPNKRKAA